MSRPVKNGNGWRIRWTNEYGERKSSNYPTFKEASEALILRKHEAQLIKSGRMEKFFEEKKFEDLCDYFIRYVAPTKRSQKDFVSIILSQLKPFFGKLYLKDITQEQVQHYTIQKAKADRSQKTIANHLTLLVSMLNYAHDMNWLRVVPKIRKPKIPKTKIFFYLKTDDEIVRFLSAAKKFGEINYYLYAMAIFTGMRQGELAGLTWDDIDFFNRRICVQRSFKNPTKNGEIRYVPILDSLLPILVEWNKKKSSHYVFPSSKGTMILPAARIFQEQFKQVLIDAGFSDVWRSESMRSYIRFHDLRHTFASHWMMKNGDIYRLQKILGHHSIEMTQRYSHLTSHIYQEDYSRFNTIKL